MEELRPSIPLLCFRAGTLCLGIAAEDVFAVSEETCAEDIHIATLLGFQPSGAERGTIRLSSVPTDGLAPQVLAFQADLPLDVVECRLESILPLPRGTSMREWRPVIGFARFAEQVVLLLDIPSLFDRLMKSNQRGMS